MSCALATVALGRGQFDPLVANDGVIFGLGAAGSGIDAVAAGTIINNNASGRIYGAAIAIRYGQVGNGGEIHSAGDIWSDKYAIKIDIVSVTPTLITNVAGGVIRGPLAAILVTSGSLFLDNDASIVGDIVSTETLGRDGTTRSTTPGRSRDRSTSVAETIRSTASARHRARFSVRPAPIS